MLVFSSYSDFEYEKGYTSIDKRFCGLDSHSAKLQYYCTTILPEIPASSNEVKDTKVHPMRLEGVLLKAYG